MDDIYQVQFGDSVIEFDKAIADYYSIARMFIPMRDSMQRKLLDTLHKYNPNRAMDTLFNFDEALKSASDSERERIEKIIEDKYPQVKHYLYIYKGKGEKKLDEFGEYLIKLSHNVNAAYNTAADARRIAREARDAKYNAKRSPNYFISIHNLSEFLLAETLFSINEYSNYKAHENEYNSRVKQEEARLGVGQGPEAIEMATIINKVMPAGNVAANDVTAAYLDGYMEGLEMKRVINYQNVPASHRMNTYPFGINEAMNKADMMISSDTSTDEIIGALQICPYSISAYSALVLKGQYISEVCELAHYFGLEKELIEPLKMFCSLNFDDTTFTGSAMPVLAKLMGVDISTVQYKAEDSGKRFRNGIESYNKKMESITEQINQTTEMIEKTSDIHFVKKNKYKKELDNLQDAKEALKKDIPKLKWQ